MEPEVQSEINKLRRLKQYQNIDESVLEKQAQRNVVLRDLVESGNFIDDTEKKLAKKIFEGYLGKLDYENPSDLSTLSMLIFNEVLSNRVQKSINECTSKDGKSYISDKLLKAHTDLINEILKLKVKLGIDRESKQDDEMTALQLLKKRFASWVLENRDECTMAIPFECSGCGKQDVKMVLLRKRVKDFESVDHPWFQGRFYINAYLIQMVEDGKMTREDCAKAHKVSVDHIDFVLKNKGKIFLADEKKV
jgi:hypothetical protein